MEFRRNLYVSAFVGASLSYIFTVIAFTGELNLFRWIVFAVFFLIVMYGFEKFIKWAERFED
ncbi:MAG: hypothetical protein PWP14_1835 [Methanolobus sp.]|nr:hypothetical protein [Methanolobus sp.]